jgi:tRNA uridine 5-carboxymethylaminomethyl modification enzyme
MVGANKKTQEFLASHDSSPIHTAVSIADLIRRPELSYEIVEDLDTERPDLELDREVVEQINIYLKYEGYIDRQQSQVEHFIKMESKKIPADIDYSKVKNLRIEARQKLEKVRPESIGQASRISGVSPADVTMLMLYLNI